MSSSKFDDRLVKKAYQRVAYNVTQIDELKACLDPVTGPMYFLREFMWIQHATKGKIKFEPYPFQYGLIDTYHNYRKSINMVSRQMGKSTVAVGYLLWYAMFNPNSTILIAAHKYEGALEIMQRLRFAYESVPDHIRSGVLSYNKKSIEFDNGSRIISQTTTANTGRGLSISLIYLDEFAFVDRGIAQELWTSLAPTLSTGGKIIITSTPDNDEDQFAQLWFTSNKLIDEFGNETPVGPNGFRPFFADWTAHPDRDEAWEKEQLSELGEEKFRREHLCVAKNTLVQIQKTDLTKETLTIEQLHGLMRGKEQYRKNTKKIKIRTYDGYKNFAGVEHKGDREIVRVSVSDGTFIECTTDHEIFINDSTKIPAGRLTPGNAVVTSTGMQSVEAVTRTGEIVPVYDVIEVAGGNRFYANNILVSNCQFISFEETLIAASTITSLEGTAPKDTGTIVRWYRDINPEATYVVGLDPAMGTGGDSAAIQVFELPGLHQVAEWKHNKTIVERQVALLREILTTIEQEGASEIYWSIENNTLGEAALVVIRDTGEEHFPGTMLHDPKQRGAGKRKGFTTTHKSKLEACSKFKSLLESGKLKLYSKAIISEIKTYVSNGNSYEARTGATDDLISATLLCIWMMEYISLWDEDSHSMVSSSLGIRNGESDDDDDYEMPMPVAFM